MVSAHVDAVVLKAIEGGSSNPKGGILSQPLKKTKTSSRVASWGPSASMYIKYYMVYGE